MQRWQLSLGLAGGALVAAWLAPTLFPMLGSPSEPEPIPVVVAPPPPPAEPAPEPEPRNIDVVIAIDTSGSMERLIDSTRARLWDIVNTIDAEDPEANLRVGLMAYGSPAYGQGSGYVRVVMPLTDDLDALYTKAWELSTNGGDEYVGQVISSASRLMNWTPKQSEHDRRLLFVAGNETAALGPVSLSAAAATAQLNGVVVSTLFAGRDASGRNLQWDRVAELGGGSYVAIDARQSAVAVSTPYDRELAELNAALNNTYVPGSIGGKQAYGQMLRNDDNAGRFGIGGLASRVATKGSGKLKADSWDLVEQRAKGRVDFDDIDVQALPDELQGLEGDALIRQLDAKVEDRKQTKRKINAIQKARSKHIAEQAAAEDGSGMDEALSEMLPDLL